MLHEPVFIPSRKDARVTDARPINLIDTFFTFSLGTSGGDLISEQFGLGYAVALGLFAGGIPIAYALYRLHVINGVLAFWAAYILTRPLGASAGDLITQAPSDGGLGIGRLPSTAVILLVIIALVAYLSAQDRKARSPQR